MNPGIVQQGVGGPFAGGAIPPPPPPPPPRNLQQGTQQWQGQNSSFPQPPQPMMNSATAPPPSGYPNPQYAIQQQQQQQPGSYAPPTSVSNISIPSDILGLAEKAASAVAELNSMSRQQQQPPPAMAPPPSNSYQNQNNMYRQDKKDTKLSDLSPMVQYSVKNLMATGHLDKELGDNACRLLSQIPEPVALQALEKFSSCDVSIMRSKEGYLIGIIRKAADRV